MTQLPYDIIRQDNMFDTAHMSSQSEQGPGLVVIEIYSVVRCVLKLCVHADGCRK